jgi:hypothetical protein
MSDSKSVLADIVDRVRIRRYPTLTVLESSRRDQSCPYAEVAASCRLRVVDYREDVLAVEAGIVLGAYTWGEFIHWLKTESAKAGGLLVMNADDLISTWDVEERRAFWREFLKTECNAAQDHTQRAPIVLVSHLAREYAAPSDRTGQGLVADIETIIGE